MNLQGRKGKEQVQQSFKKIKSNESLKYSLQYRLRTQSKLVYIQPRIQAKDSEAAYTQSKYRLKTLKDYMLRWAGKPARDYLKSLPESEFKYEGSSAEAILQALEEKTKPKSNEIAAFTKLCSLKQGDMPLSEFIHEARRLAEICNYPKDQDRLIRDTIVSGIQSLRV